MNKFVKILCVLMAVAFATSGIIGCAQQIPSPQSSSASPVATTAAATETPVVIATATETPVDTPLVATNWTTDTSPITIDVYFNASWMAMQWITDVPTMTTAYITKRTGVTINILTPTGSEAEKMNTMIASGDVPDVIMANTWDKEMQAIIAAGLVQPLNKLADQYDKSFYEIVAPSQMGWYTKADGNIYDYPNFANAYEKVQEAIAKNPDAALKYTGDTCVAVRKDIYEAIGSPDMTTPEGFLGALQAAKAKFPTVGGKPLIPINFAEITETGSGALFGITLLANVPAYTADGKMNDTINDPEYIRWLKTLRKANELGLVSKDIFMDKRAQIEEKTLNGRYFVSMMGKSDISGNNTTLYVDMGGKDTGLYYMPVDAMRNSKGENPAINAKIMLDGWMNSFITTKCRDTARAFRFLNYINGPEGQHDAFYGELGVAYDVVDGVDTYKPFIVDQSISMKELDKKYFVRGSNWLWFNSDIINAYPIVKAPFNPIELFNAYAAKYIAFRPEFSGLTLSADSKEALAKSIIDIEWGTTVTKLIIAKSDAEFDQILTDFNAKRLELGYEKVRAAQQKMLDTNKQKLGIK